MSTLEATLFREVLECTRCERAHDPNLVRDSSNPPQPGFVGPRYAEARVLLIGQNPRIAPERLGPVDKEYINPLLAFLSRPEPDAYSTLREHILRYVPSWPIHGRYFPLTEAGLTVDQIAFCNVVRCRTTGNAQPGPGLVGRCVATHLDRWVEVLRPRVIVFLGKWSADRGAASAIRFGVPFYVINRDRSLTSAQRAENRAEVAARARVAAG
jgi:hypothetical protein